MILSRWRYSGRRLSRPCPICSRDVNTQTDGWEEQFIREQRVARLATVDEQGRPHAVPIVYAYDGQRLFTPLDAKPKRVGARQLKRVRNIEQNPQVMVIIDHYSEDWGALAWVQLQGEAVVVEQGPLYKTGLALLTAKYPQYEDMPLTGRPLIILTIQRRRHWRGQK
jgi:PPOX class probable F420-dependent enzyme